MMRRISVFPLLPMVFLTAVHAEVPSVVAPHQAESLDPEDIGIGKFVFEATPPAGKVMVLRCTRTEKRVQPPTVVQETICYTNGAHAREVVLVFDPSRFPFNPDQRKPGDVRVRAQGVENPIGMNLFGTITTRQKLELEFTNNAGGRLSLTYECFVEDYASVKARIPDLPAATAGAAWKFNSPLPGKWSPDPQEKGKRRP